MLGLSTPPKTIHIRIASDDLTVLLNGHYRLCFAKKIQGSGYNVVWQSYAKYLMNNEFAWQPQYQLFCTSTFQNNHTVQASTNLVDVQLGEQCTLSKQGVLNAPVMAGSATTITMLNNYGYIHPGLSQLSIGIEGKAETTPVYVTVQPIVIGRIDLTPVDKVLVWFEQNIETGTLFNLPPPQNTLAHAISRNALARATSLGVEIDLTSADAATRLYQNGQWRIPPS